MSAWSDWQPLELNPAPSAATLAEILDGGQAFRWHRQADGVWRGAWGERIAELKISGAELRWRAPAALAAQTAPALRDYFAADQNWAELADTLPWRSDPHLARCLAAFPGLRILRQPLGETLLHFLCSATKQIVQIKQMSALLATRHGVPLEKSDDAGAVGLCPPVEDALLHRLPSWPELAEIPETELRRCLLGFRARHIHQTARFLAARPGWLDASAALSYAEAKEKFRELPGVGEKIADCVLLFGAGKLEAFPVDVWILKSMADRYGLHGWPPAQVAHFGRVHFGPLAGLAQQFLFAFERKAAGRQAAAGPAGSSLRRNSRQGKK